MLCNFKGRRLGQARKRGKAGSAGAMHAGLLARRERQPKRERWDPQCQARRGGRGLPLPLLPGRPGERLAAGGDEESHEICGPGPGARGAETCMTLGREIQMRRGGGYIRFDLAYR